MPLCVQVVGQRSAAAPQLFREREFNFEKLGIGGLDLQFEQIFRRAFASRVFPPEMVRCTAPHTCDSCSTSPPASMLMAWRPCGTVSIAPKALRRCCLDIDPANPSS
jgi:hypothetical protein